MMAGGIPGAAPARRDALLAAAQDIASRLLQAGRLPMGDASLRDGSLGVAVFFAALARAGVPGGWRGEALDLASGVLGWIDPAVPVEAADGCSAAELARLEDIVRTARYLAVLTDQAHLLAIAGRAAARLGDTPRWQAPLGLPAGAAGGLAGLGDAPEEGRLSAFAASVAQPRLEPVDGFVHGTAGKIDALLSAARRHGQGELAHAAYVQAALALDRARARGWQAAHRGVPAPGLLHGLAGIGYVLLRLADPEALPGLSDAVVPRS